LINPLKTLTIKVILTINHGRCVTLVLQDTLSTKHDHRCIWTLYLRDWCR